LTRTSASWQGSGLPAAGVFCFACQCRGHSRLDSDSPISSCHVTIGQVIFRWPNLDVFGYAHCLDVALCRPLASSVNSRAAACSARRSVATMPRWINSFMTRLQHVFDRANKLWQRQVDRQVHIALRLASVAAIPLQPLGRTTWKSTRPTPAGIEDWPGNPRKDPAL
jgi:hypothetical protein